MTRAARLRRSPWLAAAAVLAAASPAAADWLIMRDGARVETKGAWTVQGSMVVFHTPNGTLSSVRLRDADLDASREATDKAKLPPPAPAATPAPKKAPIVITDADLKPPEPAPAAPAAASAATPATAGTPASSSAAGSATASASAPGTSAAAAAQGNAASPVPSPEPAAAERLRIANWEQDLDASQSGVVLVGELRNTSADVVGDIVVTVKLLDEDGAVVATAKALLGTSALRPGQQTVMRASFPGVYTFSDVSFETSELALRSFAQEPKPSAR